MLREIVKVTEKNYNLEIPEEYLNKEVEILVIPFSYPQKNVTKKEEKKSLAGALRKYANTSLIEKEKEIAWEKVTKDKNALS